MAEVWPGLGVVATACCAIPGLRGDMVELSSEWTPPALVVELVWRRDEPLGPAARWLAERFAVQLQAIG